MPAEGWDRLHGTVQRARLPATTRPALQKVRGKPQGGTIEVFFQRWLHRLPLPLTAADRGAGWWWELSMAQVEVSRHLVFTQPRYARGFSMPW